MKQTKNANHVFSARIEREKHGGAPRRRRQTEKWLNELISIAALSRLGKTLIASIVIVFVYYVYTKVDFEVTLFQVYVLALTFSASGCNI